MSPRFRIGSRQRSSPDGSVPLGGRIFGAIFGLFFAGIGGVFLWLATVHPLLEQVRTRSWQETPARIVSSAVERDGERLEPVIRYRYEFGGRTFQSDQIYLRPPDHSYADAQRLVDSLPEGGTPVAFVNPEVPDEAVLFRNAGDSLWIGLFALPFALIGLTVAGFALFGKSKAKRAKGFSSSRARAKNLRPGLAVFGLPFLAAGLGFGWFGGVSPLLRSQAAADWPEVPCRIDESFVETHRDSDGNTTYSVEIRFTYEREGKTYHGDKYTFGSWSSSGRAEKEAVVRRYPGGSEATCLVNPDDPYEAVITAEVGLLPYGIIAFGGVFVTVGAGLIVAGFRPKKAPLAVSVPGAGSGAAPAAAAGGAPAGGPAPATLELRPVTGRKVRVVVAVLVAVFWNGISSLPIIFFFKEKDHGGPDWFLLILGLVFVAIGLLLIGLAVYSILSLKNPLPRVRIEPGRVEPGRSFRLSWHLKGSISRLRNLGIHLEGMEVARYQRGTSTVTDRNVFAQSTLFESTDKGAFREGTVEAALGEESVPSMKTDHNEIVWQIVVRGEIRRWPDLNESYLLPVRPVADNH
ncbi:MAG: DUF3592 domain-containing protein [Puniceicoccaceae bacterium]